MQLLSNNRSPKVSFPETNFANFLFFLLQKNIMVKDVIMTCRRFLSPSVSHDAFSVLLPNYILLFNSALHHLFSVSAHWIINYPG